MSSPFFTIGHSTNTAEEFLEFLRNAHIELVVDVRKLTGSKKFPQFNDDALAGTLGEAGIGYRILENLGGRRRKSQTVDPSVNGMWQNQSFHNYADYALSSQFSEGLAALRTWGQESRVAVMCSEAVWWRCHRRIIADHLLAHGEEVSHIIGEKIEPAQLMPGAAMSADKTVTYPAD